MSNIDGLAADWLTAKAAEDAAKNTRLKIEAEITSALEAKDEGSITHKLDKYKVTLNQPIYRKVDAKAWELVKNNIPEALHPVKVEIKADPAGMKWLNNNDPEMWAKVATAFETKPGKISVKVEEMK